MTARRDGDHYVINGTKTWITNGVEGSCFALLVKTDPQRRAAPQGHEPVHRAEEAGASRSAASWRSSATSAIDSAELVFEDYRVPADHLIGGVEGQGFYQATGGLELGRINVAARGVGIAEGALQARDRIRPGAQDLRQADLRAPGDPAQARRDGDARARRAAADARRRRRPSTAASAATWKPAWPSISPREAALENAIEGMRIHGAYGYSKEYDIERLYRDAPLTCIGEGTNEMQRIIISKQWLKRNPAHEAPRGRAHRLGRAVRRRPLRHRCSSPTSAPR